MVKLTSDRSLWLVRVVDEVDNVQILQTRLADSLYSLQMIW